MTFEPIPDLDRCAPSDELYDERRSNAIDILATGQDFETSREALHDALSEYEKRFGPLGDGAA